MHLVEQHVISKTDPRFATIDAAAFKAKNLYNAANYLVRQAFIFERRYLGYAAIFHLIKHPEAYTALPRKVSNDILRQLDKNWRAFFAACEAYREDPSPFTGRPKLPKYKDKTKGRFLLIYDLQAISRRALVHGQLRPSGLDIEVQTTHKAVKQARIVPRIGYYVVEIVYEKPEAAPSGNPALYAAVDLGVDTLAAITSNKVGFLPRLVNGRPIKPTNQFYNKRRAELQEALGHPGTTKRMERLTTKRTRRINHYLHATSKTITAVLVSEGIGTLVIGKNLLVARKRWRWVGSITSILSRYRTLASSTSSATRLNSPASRSRCKRNRTRARRPSSTSTRCRSTTPSGKRSRFLAANGWNVGCIGPRMGDGFKPM